MPWAGIAVECGYYDQAHLTRDFRQFAGQPPMAFVSGEGELSRHLTSPERVSVLLAGLMSHSYKTPSKLESKIQRK